MRRPALAEHIVDVFVYVVVLNLAIQYLPRVISETFTLSLLTAVLLKVVLEVVVSAKDRVKARVKTARSGWEASAALVVLWLVLVGSKFLVLALIDLVFGDNVDLGNFWSVTGLVLALMAARYGVRRLLAATGEETQGEQELIGR